MFSSYFELTKPRLIFLALTTTFLGFFVGGSGPLPWKVLFHALLGTAFVGGGVSALNQWLEKDIDATMDRTRHRPLPAGKLSSAEALIFGLFLSFGGIATLFIFVNALTAILGIATFVSYVVIYTPLKRVTTLNTFVGAFPGALPILMGWSARRGELDWGALSLFLILFFWQIPHFFSIAWHYRHDYLKSGLRMSTISDPDGRKAVRLIGLTSGILLAAGTGPVWAGISGYFYLTLSVAAGLILLGFLVYLAKQKQIDLKKFATASIVYLVFLISAMMADKMTMAGPAGEPSQSLPFYGTVADFALTEKNGRVFSRNDLSSRVWVAGFMFTRCAGQCPALNLQMSRLQQTLPKEIKLVSFSVDPKNDTPEVLSDYSKKYNAREGQWFFLTGPQATIDAVLKSVYMNSAEEPALHSLRFVLIDKDAQIRGYYDSSDAQAMKKLKEHARALVSQEGGVYEKKE